VTPKTAIVHGNTLMWESNWAIDDQAAKKPGWSIVVHSFPSAVPCDFVSWLPSDLATYHPAIVAIETAGGNTSSCMLDANGNQLPIGSDAYYAKERVDINSFFEIATTSGSRVVFIASPPFVDRGLNAASPAITAIAKVLAASYPGVSASSKPRNSVSNAGTGTATKPCLRTDTATMGCAADGTIPVRTTAAGPQYGLHFRTEGLPPVFPWWCAACSSGEHRRGTAAVNTVVSPPAPILPTVLVGTAAAVEEQALIFRPRLKSRTHAT
jgi:hypothetical protein